MNWTIFWTVSIFLLFCGILAEETEEDPEYVVHIMHTELPLVYFNPIDFRCSQQALSRFNFSDGQYYSMYYYVRPDKVRCRYPLFPKSKKGAFYPTPTAHDPMIPVYIDLIHEGILRTLVSPKIPLELPSQVERRKRYCLEMRRIGSTFADYIEIFSSDNERCWKMKEIVKECSTFRQASTLWAGPVYDRFCLDENGCYTTMELYEDDMPHCVKYIAKGQFQNASFGSWHHSIINYCQLTDMLPEAKHASYDKSILLEDDKTEDDLMAMCQFLRFRLLPEEGKEEEIREITLEEGGHRDADIERKIASDRTIYGTIIILIVGF